MPVTQKRAVGDEPSRRSGSRSLCFRSTICTPLLTVGLTCLAEVQTLAGMLDDAERTLDEALTLVPEEGCWRPETMRLRGGVRRKQNRDQLAETDFRQAIVLAQEKSAKSWELRAVMSLARLWRDQGRHADARELLAPVYGWFTEGFDTPDLIETKALLDALA